MIKSSKKVVFLIGALVAIFVLSGCGLNQRSASSSEPVVVEPLTDPAANQNNGQTGGEQTGGEANSNAENNGATGEGDNNSDQGQSNDGGTTDQSQPADNGDQNADNANADQAAETPREEQPAATAVPVEPQPTEPPAPQPTAPPATNAGGKHSVLAGQTLYSIAQSYGLTVQELAAANGIVNPNLLSVGEELVIPSPGSVVIPETATVHTVVYGDTVFKIATRYGVTVEQIALHNNLPNINRIDIGQQIKIPSQ